ncbi:MAG: CheR family methyltransferase [Pyrinomonadaceae bacterium]
MRSPHSIALALSEAGWFDRLPIEIFATDANILALEKARQGVYWGRNVDAFSRDLRDKYFTSVKGGWQAAPEIQNRIRWSLANLVVASEITEFADAHLIFCQQVFIYFLDARIVNTIRSFERQMPFGGYLFSDSGDHYISLIGNSTNLVQQEFEPTSVWRKLK